MDASKENSNCILRAPKVDASIPYNFGGGHANAGTAVADGADAAADDAAAAEEDAWACAHNGASCFARFESRSWPSVSRSD